MRSIKYILLLLTATVALSCTERIDIELDSTFTRLVVDGSVTNLQGSSEITLSYTGDYFANNPMPLVAGALVTISDGQQSWTFNEKAPGVYKAPIGFAGSPGNSYALRIDQVEIDGSLQSFTATSTMPVAPVVDSIQVNYQPNWKVWAVNLFAWDPPSRENYLFRVYRNNVLVTDTIDRWIVVSDELFNGNYTFGVMAQFLREDQASVGDTIELELSSIPEDYARFIWEVQEASGYNSPLFSGPPANVRTNISNGAIGYFSAYSTVRTRTVIKRK